MLIYKLLGMIFAVYMIYGFNKFKIMVFLIAALICFVGYKQVMRINRAAREAKSK